MFYKYPYIFFRDISYLNPLGFNTPIYKKPEIKFTSDKLTSDMLKKIEQNSELLIEILKIIINGIYNKENLEKIKEKISKNLKEKDINIHEFIHNPVTDHYLLNDSNLKEIYDTLNDSDIIKKICAYGKCAGAFNLTFSQSGGKYVLSNSTKIKSEVQVCYNNICIESKKECINCDKWIKERMEFKDKFIEFINQKDGNIFEFIYDNINYLPVLILDQLNYHKFFELYKEYNKGKINKTSIL